MVKKYEIIGSVIVITVFIQSVPKQVNHQNLYRNNVQHLDAGNILYRV